MISIYPIHVRGLSYLPETDRCHVFGVHDFVSSPLSAESKMTFRDPVTRNRDYIICFGKFCSPRNSEAGVPVDQLPSQDVLVTAISANPMPDGNVCHQAWLLLMTHHDRFPLFFMILVITTMLGYFFQVCW